MRVLLLLFALILAVVAPATASAAPVSQNPPGSCPEGYVWQYDYNENGEYRSGTEMCVTPAEQAAEIEATKHHEEAVKAANERTTKELLHEHDEGRNCHTQLAGAESSELAPCEQHAKERETAEKSAAAGAAIEVQDKRLQAEYEAAEQHALKSPVTQLSVKTVARRGDSSQLPGETVFTVRTTSFAHVTVTLARHGHRTERFNADPNAVDAVDDPTAPEPIPAVMNEGSAIVWSCSSPGGTYRYTVTAKSNVGRTLTRRGTFKPVSVARCHELKRHEQEARNRSIHRYDEEVAQRIREEHERLIQWETNCRALGGSPVILHTPEGTERACRSPNGGELPVPE